MGWEAAIVGAVVAACAATLIVKFLRSMKPDQGACACSGCPATKLAKNLRQSD